MPADAMIHVLRAWEDDRDYFRRIASGDAPEEVYVRGLQDKFDGVEYFGPMRLETRAQYDEVFEGFAFPGQVGCIRRSLVAGLFWSQIVQFDRFYEDCRSWGDAIPENIESLIDMTDPETGASCLHIAAQANAAATIEWLLKRGLPIETTDDRGQTPLAYAARNGADSAAIVLLDCGARTRLETLSGRPQFLMRDAVYYCSPKTVRRFCEMDDSWDMDSALEIACEWRALDMVQTLIQAGCDPESPDAFRSAAGSSTDAFAKMRLLLDLGADPRSVLDDPHQVEQVMRRQTNDVLELLGLRPPGQPPIVAAARRISGSFTPEDCPDHLGSDQIEGPVELSFWVNTEGVPRDVWMERDFTRSRYELGNVARKVIETRFRYEPARDAKGDIVEQLVRLRVIWRRLSDGGERVAPSIEEMIPCVKEIDSSERPTPGRFISRLFSRRRG
jgi:hypothetical protein